MADTLKLQVVTPHRLVFEGDVDGFIAPGQEGEVGILPGHDPWFILMGMGPLKVGAKQFFVNGGFCQVDSDHVRILAEIGERAEDIDVERAKAAKDRAEKRLGDALKNSEIDVVRAELALRRALYRLDIAHL